MLRVRLIVGDTLSSYWPFWMLKSSRLMVKFARMTSKSPCIFGTRALKLVLEIGQFDRHGDFFGHAVQGERAGDLGGGDVAFGLHIGERLGFKGDFRILGHVQPVGAVQMFFLHRVGHGQGFRRHHDFAGGGRRVLRIERDGAADAVGAAVDGFQRRVQIEDRVVDALRILEIEGFRRGISRRGQGEEGNDDVSVSWFIVGLFVIGCLFSGLRKKNDAPASSPRRQQAAPRKSTPGRNFFW